LSSKGEAWHENSRIGAVAVVLVAAVPAGAPAAVVLAAAVLAAGGFAVVVPAAIGGLAAPEAVAAAGAGLRASRI